MGRTKWFHSKVFHMAARGFWLALETFVGFIVHHVGNNKKGKKGGGEAKERPVRKEK